MWAYKHSGTSIRKAKRCFRWSNPLKGRKKMVSPVNMDQFYGAAETPLDEFIIALRLRTRSLTLAKIRSHILLMQSACSSQLSK
ncbi:Hypothetical predicted protein [Cloeon dipterum]|uniref:Uncharacterized protein n=1 Tax=Cloeon dipterum TaxID=197152 RepID=A0A8S1D5K9_9INSE|nr:Hypothetical predicted protein [Cloeon dipterum]